MVHAAQMFAIGARYTKILGGVAIVAMPASIDLTVWARIHSHNFLLAQLLRRGLSAGNPNNC
ncbi:MAG: hypothetical protein WA889_15320, partial [Xanthobacteraceae bacterium]